MPSQWAQAALVTIQDGLTCPHCGATNRPEARVIELHADTWRADCNVCAFSGTVGAFRPHIQR